MAPQSIVSVTDGPRTTVSDLVGAPKALPKRIIDIVRAGLISEAILRNAGGNTNGLVSFEESTPLFLGDDVETVAEFAEIPVGAGQIGTPRVAIATKKGLAVRVSKEMIDENRIDDVNRQITQVANTFKRFDDRAARRILDTAPTMPVSAPWGGGTAGKPRTDLAKAIEVLASARPDGALTTDEYLGFEADTMVVHPALAAQLIDNADILAVYKEAAASEQSIAYTGKLPNQIFGLTVLQSRSFPLDRVLICERGTMGFYSDTRPLQATGLYPEGGGPNGGPTETWRSDTTIKRALGLDQPKAALWLTGIA